MMTGTATYTKSFTGSFVIDYVDGSGATVVIMSVAPYAGLARVTVGSKVCDIDGASARGIYDALALLTPTAIGHHVSPDFEVTYQDDGGGVSSVRNDDKGQQINWTTGDPTSADGAALVALIREGFGALAVGFEAA